ncbi:Ca2+:H+ antiporter [Phakopsora pachyrhizi]|uniref:Ca2+:H+ antiporter n=1 Tax=Phakopsora pachyrhizi TaxID=170000 RepID=A0AAV0B8T2_PHAPC|nr:Ca2+:H+ antiporter [Phakopsora pachyrhizi]CAH7683394.1 Ca2+:H+ antiporter [Phakopsora pachyrhizi]
MSDSSSTHPNKQSKPRKSTSAALDARSGSDAHHLSGNRVTSLGPVSDQSAHLPLPASHTAGQPPHSSTVNPHSFSGAAAAHHTVPPSKAPLVDDIEDDEVQPIDRGEALVRRRMKERQRLKKEAERRLRKADEENRSRPSASTIHTRPSASRTRTAPSHPHQHQSQTLPLPGADRGLVSPSLESLWAQQGTTANDSGSNAEDVNTSSFQELSNNSPVSPSVSPTRGQSSYQSFGSPSQFSAAAVAKASTVEQPLPSPPGQVAHPIRSRNSISQPRSASKRFVSTQGPVTSTTTAKDDLGQEYDIEDTEGNFGPSTPTSKGVPRSVPAVSVRSMSTTRRSETRPTSRLSCSRSRSEHRSGQSSSSADEADEVISEGNPADAEQDLENSSTDENDEDVEYTLKDRQDAINIEHPFGLPIWKPALYKKSRSVARNAEAALHDSPASTSVSTFNFGNLLWSLVVGVWLALIFSFVAAVLFVIPWGGSKYGRVVWELAGYLVWPFGKYVEEWMEEDEDENSPESDADLTHGDEPGELNQTGSQPSRWVTISEIDEDEVDSVGCLTIREGGSRDEESTPLTSNKNASKIPNYGTLNQESTNSHHESKEPLNSPSWVDLLKGQADKHSYHKKHKIRIRSLGRLSFWAAYYLIIAPLMLVACLLCWFFVFTIPMAKLLWVLIRHVGAEPLALHFRSPPKYIDLDQVEAGPSNESGQGQLAQQSTNYYTPLDRTDDELPPRLKPGQPAPRHSKKSLSESRAKGRLVSGKAKVLLCTYKALGLQYYKYTVDGVNIIFIILMPFVIFVIFDSFFLVPLKLEGFLGVISSQGVIFVLALLSVIPLSYFIGMAVASISAQSSIGMGAVINATFGSIIEILLYGIALTEGKGELVEGSIIGSVLAGVLLMPGLSMIGGSLRRKEQKFNARSAGVTSTMLIMAIIGTLTPTLFYEIYGTFELSCTGCPEAVSEKIDSRDMWQCRSCKYVRRSPVYENFYQDSVKGLSYYCAALLVLSYLIGLWFSLRTHASQIWQTPAHPHAVEQAHHISNALPAPHPPMSELPDHPDMSHQQRMSMYVRKLPEIVKQQLLPHLRTSSNPADRKTSNNGLRTDGSSTSKPNFSSVGSHEVGFSSLPRTLTTEEVQETLQILGMATAEGLSRREHEYSSSQAHPILGNISDHSQVPNSQARSSSKPFSTNPHQSTYNITPTVQNVATEDQAGGGHDAPNWSRMKSTTVLLSCTFLYAVIAEVLVDVVDVVLDGSGIPEKFLGITLFALVPNTTEFMNAISFAINGNIALSMEIGSAYALQVCLIQIPAMIAISSIYNAGKQISAHHVFTLIFPRWDSIAIIFSVFLLTYTYIEARANYHRGTILVLSYLVLIGGFYTTPVDKVS